MRRIPTRIIVLAAVIGSVAIIIIIQLFVVAAGSSEEQGRQRRRTLVRGNIFDRNQRILAMETRLDSVAMWMPDVARPAQSVAQLSEILRISVDDLRARIADKDGYVLIKRYASQEESQNIREYQQAGELRGVILEPIAGRIYPQRSYASTVVGYIGTDNIGLDGIEYSMNVLLEPDGGGRIPRGHDVFLTIDIVLQAFVDQVAQEAQAEEKTDSIIAIVMDAGTGEILALSSIPHYDPNQFGRYSAQQRRNRAILDIYEPGSVFKVFTMAAILEQGGIRSNDYFDTASGYRGTFEEYEITDLAPYGIINTAEIIKLSSNIGAAIASETISRDDFFRILSEFGFGKSTDVTLNGEENGIFRAVTDWTDRTKPTIAIGQEIGVTAMQIVSAATAIAGDGRVLRPEIVRRVVAPDGEVVYESAPQYVATPISVETAAEMREMMRGATDAGGTASRIRINNVNIAAKTGTAEVFDTQTAQYSTERFVASALALVPAEKPQYIVYFVADYPKAENVFGGRIAAPRVREIIEYLISYRGVQTAARTTQ